MSAVIPNELIYEPAPLPLGSRIRRIKFESSEGVSSGGSLSKINIQKGRNQYMNCKNSWLNFTVQAHLQGALLPIAGATTNNANLRVDPMGLAMAIQKIELISDNQPVSIISDYNKIYAMLQVSQANPNSAGVRALATGSSYELSGASGPNTLLGNSVVGTYGPVLTGSTATDCTTPLMSCSLPLLGILGSANIPISQINGGLSIHITWTNSVRDFLWGNGSTATAVEIKDSSTFEFTNVSFEAEITTMDDSSELEIEKENKFKTEPVMWSDVAYYATPQTFDSTVLGVTQTINTLVPSMRWNSLQALYLGGFCEKNSTLSSISTQPLSVPHIFIDELRYRAGGIEHPKNWIDSLSQMVNHTVACYSNVSQSVTGGLMVGTYTTRNFRNPGTIATSLNFVDRGVVGVNFESFPQILAISGIDTKTVDCEFQARITAPTVASAEGISAYFLSLHNVVYTISDGVLRVSD